MRIDFLKASTAYNTQSAQSTQSSQAVESVKKEPQKTSSAASNNQDRIDLSPRAKKIASEWSGKTAMMSELTKTDEAKLERLSNLIAKGEYRVSSDKIADAILGKKE